MLSLLAVSRGNLVQQTIKECTNMEGRHRSRCHSYFELRMGRLVRNSEPTCAKPSRRCLCVDPNPQPNQIAIPAHQLSTALPVRLFLHTLQSRHCEARHESQNMFLLIDSEHRRVLRMLSYTPKARPSEPGSNSASVLAGVYIAAAACLRAPNNHKLLPRMLPESNRRTNADLSETHDVPSVGVVEIRQKKMPSLSSGSPYPLNAVAPFLSSLHILYFSEEPAFF